MTSLVSLPPPAPRPVQLKTFDPGLFCPMLMQFLCLVLNTGRYMYPQQYRPMNFSTSF